MRSTRPRGSVIASIPIMNDFLTHVHVWWAPHRPCPRDEVILDEDVMDRVVYRCPYCQREFTPQEVHNIREALRPDPFNPNPFFLRAAGWTIVLFVIIFALTFWTLSR